jgi:hypothetical protein
MKSWVLAQCGFVGRCQRRQHVSPKRCHRPTKPHGAQTQVQHDNTRRENLKSEILYDSILRYMNVNYTINFLRLYLTLYLKHKFKS